MTPRSSAPRVSDSRDTGAYGGEFNMSDAEFQRVADKVFEIAGIVLKDHKRQMVYTRLSRRLRALGMTSFTVYMDHLESGAGSREITEFSNAVTTNLTSFFREAHHFDHLRHEVLEPLGKAGKSRIRVWSAGCSTGEEPYSIALTARAAARSMGAPQSVGRSLALARPGALRGDRADGERGPRPGPGSGARHEVLRRCGSVARFGSSGGASG